MRKHFCMAIGLLSLLTLAAIQPLITMKNTVPQKGIFAPNNTLLPLINKARKMTMKTPVSQPNRAALISAYLKETTPVVASSSVEEAAVPTPTPTPTPTPAPTVVYNAPTESYGSIQEEARQMVDARWGDSEWPAYNYVETREAGYNPYAVNPSSGACGLMQALPCSKLTNICSLSDIGCQLTAMLNYIATRYVDPIQAENHEAAYNWY